MSTTDAIVFYFDPVSPYSWLAGLQLERLDAVGLQVDVRPALFAGLLAAHGHKGPAEIPAKRAYTFRDVMREAARLGRHAAGPPAHPFNPLRALRMCITLDDARDRRRLGLALMEAAWGRGVDLTVAGQLALIADEAGLPGAALVARADEPGIKARLAAQTDAAIAAGVFGVPTFVCEGEIFWGADRIDALLRRAGGNRIDEAHLATMLARPAAAVRKAS